MGFAAASQVRSKKNMNNFRNRSRNLTLAAAASLLFAACQAAPRPSAPAATAAPAATVAPAAEAPTSNIKTGCVDKYDANVDYFPQKATITAASGLKIEYFKNYKVVSVLAAWPGAEKAFKYVLVQCGTPAPKDIADATVINVPAQSAIAMSTTELPVMEQLGLLDKLVGVDSFMWTNNAKVLDMIKANKLVEVGGGSDVNIEKIISVKPDVIFSSGSGSPEYDAHPKLAEAKLSEVVDGSWMEQTPMGRAEWNKFIAAFFNLEDAADKEFTRISSEYKALAEKARSADKKPTVLMNMPYKDTWSIPGGKSYVAQMLADAGMNFAWADDSSTGSLPLKFEEVLDKGAKTDLWLLNAYGVFSNTQSVVDLDTRYGEFGALKDGQVWNFDLQVNANGGNAFYESGAANPQWVLADLIKIAHPDLLPEHKFVFYRMVEKQ